MKYVSMISHEGLLYALREDGKLFLVTYYAALGKAIYKYSQVLELPVYGK